jgi:hypothetical protein
MERRGMSFHVSAADAGSFLSARVSSTAYPEISRDIHVGPVTLDEGIHARLLKVIQDQSLHMGEVRTSQPESDMIDEGQSSTFSMLYRHQRFACT